MNQVLQHGRVARGYLGIGVQLVAFPDATRQSLGISGERGLFVVTITPGSPAESSGLLLSDIIVTIEGSPCTGCTACSPHLIRRMSAGLSLGISEDTVKFHVSSILANLGADTRTEVVRRGYREGLIIL